jgi:hypothetical protein
MIIVFIEPNRNESSIRKYYIIISFNSTQERDIATLSRNASIVRKLASEVKLSEAWDYTAYLLYLSRIVGTKLGSRSQLEKSTSPLECSQM